MCGIAGILHLDGLPCDAGHLASITDALTRRGPDGRGLYCDGPLGLGHRRLAILDLSDAGAQPMATIGRRYYITYNGEVFNFLELRRELEGLGYLFVSHTDTEVIAIAYHAWGPDCLLRFNGIFAFAIWDADRRELFLARDRFGVKPLHYLAHARRFVFASELKSFVHLPGFAARENENEMRRQLAGARESREETLIQGVRQLPPGWCMRVSEKGRGTWRWWNTLDHLPTVPRRFPDQVDAFRELFTDAVRLRMRSDVPLATCLSGGLDSSSILCTAAKLRQSGQADGKRFSQNSQRAFVATFPGTRQDEFEFARAAVGQAHAVPRYHEMSGDVAIPDLLQYAYDFEMIGSVLLIPPWQLYRAMREDGVVVSLDGHAADELLGGYESTLRAELREHGGLFRRPLRALALAKTMSGMHGHDTGPSPETIDYLADLDPFLRRARRGLHFLKGVRTSPRPELEAWSAPWVDPDPVADEARDLSPLNRLLYNQFHYGILQSILRKYDRLSMAHGVESRVPFTDWRVVAFAFALPDASKVGAGYTKRILREAMRGVIPDVIRTRRAKLGFRSPMQSWFNGALGDWVAAEVQTEAFLDCPVWNGAAIRDYVLATHAERRWTEPAATRVWPYLQAHLWRQSFFGNRLRMSGGGMQAAKSPAWS